MSETTEEEQKKKEESWVSSKWRPCMGWLYMGTCAADFILFPILWALVQVMTKQSVTQWNPITLQGAGLYHVAMGAVLGVAAWSRGQEKMAGAANAPAIPGMPPTSPSPMGMQTPPTRPPLTPQTQTAAYQSRPIPSQTDHEDADMMRPRNDPESRMR